jgi:hypothetical protein
MVVTSVRLPEEDMEKVKQVAADKRVKPADVLRWAIDDYLKSLFLGTCPTNSQSEQEKSSAQQPADIAA